MFIAVGGVVHMYDEYQRRERHRQREKCKILTVRSGGRKLLHARPENMHERTNASPTFIATSVQLVLSFKPKTYPLGRKFATTRQATNESA